MDYKEEEQINLPYKASGRGTMRPEAATVMEGVISSLDQGASHCRVMENERMEKTADVMENSRSTGDVYGERQESMNILYGK